MRFMMLMIPLGYETAPPDVQLDPERVKAMMKYNEALQQAGILITLDGLHPPSMGARVSFSTGKPVVTNSRVFYLHARLRVHRAPGIPRALS